MAEGFDWDDYSESQVYMMLSIVERLDGEAKTPNPKRAWKMADYALYNYLAKNYREAKARGLVYDPFGVGVNLD
jgi:hypothetical protein